MLKIKKYGYVSKKGFTLAEMMVVMLILSIILAAMAPVMTSRNKTASSSKVWDWDTEVAAQNIAYLRAGNPIAVIGLQNGGYNAVNGQRDDARLIINSQNTDGELLPQISFLYNSNNAGRFLMYGSNVFLGRQAGSTTMSASAQNNVGIGADALRSISTGSGNTSVGAESSVTTTGSNNTTLGYMALKQAGGDNNVAIGAAANNVNNSFSNTVAVGYTTTAIGNGAVVVGSEAIANGSSAVAIGNSANSSSSSAISIGDNAKASNSVAISIGYHSEALGTSGISIGTNTKSTSAGIAIGDSSEVAASAVAIGTNSKASSGGAIAIGPSRPVAFGFNSIAIGANAYARGSGDISIGNDAYSANPYSIAIGDAAKASAWYSIAIGYNACANVRGRNKICIGANSGPDRGHDWAKSSDDTERIFIGGRSKFNNGVAVLEVHNEPKLETVNFRQKKGGGDYRISKVGVVVNGDLFVKGSIFSRSLQHGGRAPFAMQWAGTNDGYDNQVSALWANPGDNWGFYKYGGDSVFSSDRRLKYVGKENTSGLDKIRQLKVFNYTFKKDPKKTQHVGVIAQDLQKVFPNAVTKAKDGFLQIRMEDMFYAVVNAVKELDAKVTALTKEVKTMSEILKQVQSDNAQIKKDNQQLKRENQELRKILKQVQDDNKKEAARLKALESKVK